MLGEQRSNLIQTAVRPEVTMIHNVVSVSGGKDSTATPLLAIEPETPNLRRVFVVASARRGLDPAAVLFESEGVRQDTPPHRGEGQDLAGPAIQCGCGYIFPVELGPYGCPNCEGDEGPGVEVLARAPSFGGEGDAPSYRQALCSPSTTTFRG